MGSTYKPLENIKKFNGKRYSFYWGYHTKAEAQKTKTRLTRAGYLVRIIKSQLRGYLVYARHK